MTHRLAPCNSTWACWACRRTAKLDYNGGRCPCGRDMLCMDSGWKPGKKGRWPAGVGTIRDGQWRTGGRVRLGTGTFADGVIAPTPEECREEARIRGMYLYSKDPNVPTRHLGHGGHPNRRQA